MFDPFKFMLFFHVSDVISKNTRVRVKFKPRLNWYSRQSDWHRRSNRVRIYKGGSFSLNRKTDVYYDILLESLIPCSTFSCCKSIHFTSEIAALYCGLTCIDPHTLYILSQQSRSYDEQFRKSIAKRSKNSFRRTISRLFKVCIEELSLIGSIWLLDGLFSPS
jgi:hypothetical protein